MTDDASLSRRRVLATLGAGGMAGLAGCNGDDGSTETDLGTPNTPTDDPGGGGGNCPDVEYVLNTGYDQDAGSTITPCDDDDDWEVTAEDVSAGTLGRPADVIRGHPAWADPFQDSQWISVSCDGNPGLSFSKEVFEFTYCFCLNEGFNNPELDLRLRADDAIEDIRLNGNSLPFSGNGTYAGTPVEETYGNDFRRHFQAGENCLTVAIRDTGAVITGLNLAGTVTAENGECCEGTCDLGIEKTHEGPFEPGGTGTYVVEVCNEGDGICNEAAEVRDELPDAVSFDGASGSGWNVNASGGQLNATHPNSGGLDPGECLPALEIDVEVPPVEELPDEGGLENCAELVTGGQYADNDRDCTTPCLAGEQTFEGGVEDDFEGGNDEPASPSEGLQANWGGNLGDFDEGAVNVHFGHTFDDLRPSESLGRICEAELEICLKPEASFLTTNDIISLGVWDDDGSRFSPAWGRKLGNDDGQDGLFDTTWHPSSTDPRCITLDLSALPEEDGSTTDLLPLLNTHNRLSIHVQDDTSVDFANLSVTYCCDDTPPGECELTVDKSVQGEFRFGGTSQYLIEVCNEGDGACEGPVTVTDDLPDGISFVSHAGSGWDCEEQNGEVVCKHDNAGGLSPGECLPPITLEVEVAPASEWPGDEVAVNCAELAHDGRTVDESCVRHPVTGGGDCQFDLKKSVMQEFRFGEVGVYAIEVCNAGEGECDEPVTVTDQLPDGIRFVDGSGTGWSVNQQNGEVIAEHENTGGLAPGECLPLLAIEAEVVPESEWPHEDNVVENCAVLHYSDPRQRVTDCVEHEVSAGGCQLSIGKRVENTFEFSGGGAYGFRVCNEGDEPCEAEMVEITDELVDGFELIGGGGEGWSCELVDPDRNLVSCTYEGVSLQPGECLPDSIIEVDVVSESEWPHDTDTVTNCAQLKTVQEQVDEDCIEHQVQ